MRRSLLLACWLVACNDAPPPPAATAPAPIETPEPEPEPEPFVEHTLERGQTLWDVARAYGVTTEAILDANALRPRDVRRLSVGQVLKIPGVTERAEVTRAEEPTPVEELPPLQDGAYHVLAAGETLWDVAATYDKSVDELVERNALDDDAVRALRPGRAIVVPGIRERDVRRAEPAQVESRGIRHTVARGETIWDLARAFGVSVSQLMAANSLSAGDAAALREGQRLFIPGGGDRNRHRDDRLTPRQRRALTDARRLGLGSKEVAQQLLRGQVEARWMRAAGGTRLPGTLRWPVTNGRFVRGYGSGEGSYHLAVDIAGDIGWNVRAAAPGIVAYSGDEVSGYGHMVMVIHPGGWVTMYAHNSINFVVAGERVPRGGVLAELGSTGISRGPHVHFELMFGGENCDPAALFRPGVRHRSRYARIEQLEWTRPDDRPEGLQCDRRRRHPRSRWVVNE